MLFFSSQIGDHNKNIYYRDQNGLSSDDYLTLGVDHVPLFCGRTAVQCYEDFMLSFVKKFESFIGSVIEEISVGLGPSGELRYVTVTLEPKVYESSAIISYTTLLTGILHILLAMVDGTFLELVNSSAMTSTCRLRLFHLVMEIWLC